MNEKRSMIENLLHLAEQWRFILGPTYQIQTQKLISQNI